MSFSRVFILLIAGWFLAAPVRAQLTTIASDSFDYTTGATLSGKNGGTGWSAAWVWSYTSGASLKIGTGLSYTGLSTAGGSATWTSGGNGLSEGTRTLPLQNSGVVYLQFLASFASTSGGGTPNLRLLSSGTLTGGLGGNGGTYGSKISILDSTLSPKSDGSSSTGTLSGTHLLIARIDYSANETRLWVDPTLASFSYASPGTPNAIYAGLAPAFDQVTFITRSPGTIDELTVYSYSAVPEPAAMASLAGGAVFLVALRRRARTRVRPAPNAAL